MANLTYRASLTPTLPGSTTLKNAPLTNLEVDANFKSLNDGIQTLDTAVSAKASTAYVDATAASQALAMAIALG